MEHAKMNIMALVLILTVFGGQNLIREVSCNMAMVRQGFCLDNCMKGCKGTGISSLRCFKYCEKHCVAPDAAASADRSPNLHYHYCKLGCMLDKCSQFSQDEAKQESCVEKCEASSCLLE